MLLLLSTTITTITTTTTTATTITNGANKDRRNNKFLVVLLLLIIQSTKVDCLICYDGADCLQTQTCSECNGIGCIRMKSFNTEHIHAVALTCLPYAARIHQLEPAGCRISLAGDSEHCICYDNDYCNGATSSSLISFELISAFTFLFFCTISLYFLH